MPHPQHVDWQHDQGAHWTARVDRVVVASISCGEQYELTTEDGLVRGSHSGLCSAQAQLAAWYSWVADPEGSTDDR
jgi:hypothetical protein